MESELLCAAWGIVLLCAEPVGKKSRGTEFGEEIPGCGS
jgi:hypothetical protein